MAHGFRIDRAATEFKHGGDDCGVQMGKSVATAKNDRGNDHIMSDRLDPDHRAHSEGRVNIGLRDAQAERRSYFRNHAKRVLEI